MATRISEKYKKELIPALTKQFGYKNQLQVPRVASISVNIGTGKASDDTKLREVMAETLRIITGQQPTIRAARKSIASFKVREGQAVGLAVTLRGDRMEYFFDKLVNVTLARVRDFRGLNPEAFDGHGNYSFGLREQTVFPEIPFDAVDKTHGLQISITTTAQTDDEARALLAGLGMPFAKVAPKQEVTEEDDRDSLRAYAKAKAERTATKED